MGRYIAIVATVPKDNPVHEVEHADDVDRIVQGLLTSLRIEHFIFLRASSLSIFPVLRYDPVCWRRPRPDGLRRRTDTGAGSAIDNPRIPVPGAS